MHFKKHCHLERVREIISKIRGGKNPLLKIYHYRSKMTINLFLKYLFTILS